MRFSRRAFLGGLGGLALQPVPLLALAPSRQTRLARDLGAAGNGTTDDRDVLSRILSSGNIIDGGGRTFAVRGPVQAASSFGGLVNAKFVQLDASVPMHGAIQIEGAQDFTIENVTIARGGDGSEQTDFHRLAEQTGLFLNRCRGFSLTNLTVTGGGVGSGFTISNSSDFMLAEIHVHDLAYRLPVHPTDDAIQGIYINASQQFSLRDCTIKRLGGTDGTTFVRHFNRSFVFGGSRNFTVATCRAEECGQGFDVTGRNGNVGFAIRDSAADDCTSWGFKFANSAQEGVVENCTARRSGISGFVASGQTNPGFPQTQNIRIRRCTAIDPLGNHPRASYGSGFRILANPAIDKSYPRGIVFEECVAVAKSPQAKMDFGFANGVPANLTDGDPNRMDRCQVTGWLKRASVGFDNT